MQLTEDEQTLLDVVKKTGRWAYLYWCSVGITASLITMWIGMATRGGPYALVPGIVILIGYHILYSLQYAKLCLKSRQ